MRRIVAIVLVISIFFICSFNINNIDINDKKMISVEVRGEVNKEQIIDLPLGSKIKDVLEIISLKDDADIRQLSLNQNVYNNQIINIPSKSLNKLISINNADIEELISLPGIGNITAENIIEYRNKYGSFNRIEELQNVNGIGIKKFSKIKEYISL